MTDYVGVILNGLCTGLGVIFAHKLFSYFEMHKEKLKKEFSENELKRKFDLFKGGIKI